MNPLIVLIQVALLLGGVALIAGTFPFTGALAVGIAAVALFTLIGLAS